MTIKELLTYNLNRLCKDRQLNGKQLGLLLSASKSHGSQLLNGKSGIGQETIDKLCEAWGINQFDFIRLPDNEAQNYVAKGGDYTEILKRYIAHLEEENERLKGELLQFTTQGTGRTKSDAI